jgi:hypothetical protein
MRLTKPLGTLAIITLVFAYIQYRSPFTSASPDSMNLMHFWQTNVDQARRAGAGPVAVATAIRTSLASTNRYDMSRGRLVQNVLYGIDGLTRWMLPSPAINAWMILLLIINSGLIAWVATQTVLDPSVRLNVFCLGWLVLTTSALTISPVLLLILYAKYVFVAFVLASFVARRPATKLSWLIVAAFTDEFGLFFALFILWLSVFRFALIRKEGDPSCGRSSMVHIARAAFLGTVAWLVGLFTFYGIWAVGGNIGAAGFRTFARASPSRARGMWTLARGLLWRAEVLVVGLPFDHWFMTCVFGSAMLAVVAVGVWKATRPFLGRTSAERCRLDDRLRRWLGDETGFFYSFWVGMLLLVAVIILPGGAGDYSPYSYPAAAVLSVLFLRALVGVLSTRWVYVVLAVIFGAHVCLLPWTVAATSSGIERYLFPDQTVTKEDIAAINTSAMEFRKKGRSPLFDSFNNGEELDPLSGTWFYSRIKGFGLASGRPYFPVQGMVRVLAWPYFQNPPEREAEFR